jgi:hypothetical protein
MCSGDSPRSTAIRERAWCVDVSYICRIQVLFLNPSNVSEPRAYPCSRERSDLRVVVTTISLANIISTGARLVLHAAISAVAVSGLSVAPVTL